MTLRCSLAMLLTTLVLSTGCGSSGQATRTRGTLCRAATTACAMGETYCAGAVPVDAGQPQD